MVNISGNTVIVLVVGVVVFVVEVKILFVFYIHQ